MNRKQMIVISSVSAVLVVFAVTAVSADSASSTPLYTLRMEQASSRMNFLPTEINGFVYNTEKGSSITYCPDEGICGGDVEPFDTLGLTWCGTCWPYCSTNEVTCEGTYTCEWTCAHSTCPFATCYSTCPVTCYSCEGWTCDATGCQSTCSTCDDPTCPNTCWDTCDDPTCLDTCEQTCRYTCTKPCQP
ncbi:MAG: hypothetical protein HXS54_03160 [Theionarchaea archaeon]|nr:hypothetical protein [Theionarchaea archaeon]